MVIINKGLVRPWAWQKGYLRLTTKRVVAPREAHSSAQMMKAPLRQGSFLSALLCATANSLSASCTNSGSVLGSWPMSSPRDWATTRLRLSKRAVRTTCFSMTWSAVMERVERYVENENRLSESVILVKFFCCCQNLFVLLAQI